MRFKVTQLRDHGRRLRRSELSGPVIGELTIELQPKTAEMARGGLTARLVGNVYGVGSPNILPPMFDVQIIGMDEGNLYIKGTQIAAEEGVTFDHSQVWMCSPPDGS